MVEKIVILRNKLKAKKPVFKRHDAHKKARIDDNWRRPKGRQNKMRLHRKGYAKARSTGYGSPREAYGLSRSGLIQNRVTHVKDFASLDAKKDGVIIARTVGNRRRLVLLEYIEKHNFTLLHADVAKVKDAITTKLASKSSKKKAVETKRKKKAELAKKAKEEQKKAQEKAKESASQKETKVSTQKASSKDASSQEKVAEASLSEKEKKEKETKEHEKVLIKQEK